MAARQVYWRCSKYSIVLLISFSGVYFFYKTETEFSRNKSLVQSSADHQSIPNHGPVLSVSSSTTQHSLVLPYPYPYKFLKNPRKKCQFLKPFLVLMVLVESHDYISRGVIREAWGKESNYRDVTVVTVFLVGLSPTRTAHVQRLMKEENDIYGDIVQQDFMDTYNNLTIKTLMGMEWVMKFCPDASYVMKIDSDMFLNVDYLVHHVLQPGEPIRKNYFTGHIISYSTPIRFKGSKWYVSREIYPNDTYPPYCSGPGYVFSGDMAKKIYDVAQVIRFMPLEDVFMGICLHELKILPTKPPDNIFIGYKVMFDPCQYQKLVMIHHVKKAELLTAWLDFWSKKKSECKDQ
ncbi:beta-1,3-galactosyltransferase 2-like [Rhinophrynus dorsalis]